MKDQCIDAVRQTAMCHANVSPISWHVNVPVNTQIAPRLATTHTCRDFGPVERWAKARSVGQMRYRLEKGEGDRIIQDSEFNHDPDEELEEFWPAFPGNKFFKHWRDHPSPIIAGGTGGEGS
jgi:hypothetical protein